MFRLVHDPRYGLSYSPSPEECKKAWESVISDSLPLPFSLEAPEPENEPSFIEAYRDLYPPLEWPDFRGNGLFVAFCTWVLERALLWPEGFWVVLLVLLDLAVGLVQLVLPIAGWLGALAFRAVRCAERLRRGVRRCAPGNV